MKNYLLLIALFITFSAEAQKVDYKSGQLKVDGTDMARIERIKDNESFGLTGTYQLYAMSGNKLIIGTLANDFHPDRNDNGSYYYRLTFLSTNQVAIFSLSKFGPEKSFAKLVGESGIIVNDKLDPAKVTELIALKSKNPEVTTEYHLVQRNLNFPFSLKDTKEIYQGRTLIGKFNDISSTRDVDTYEFSLPEGLVVAKVSFRGGNNAKQFVISTNKDNTTMAYTIDTDKKYTSFYSTVDRNEPTLLRIVKWLSDRQYL